MGENKCLTDLRVEGNHSSNLDERYSISCNFVLLEDASNAMDENLSSIAHFSVRSLLAHTEELEIIVE